MFDPVEVVAVAGPRGSLREPLRARFLAGDALVLEWPARRAVVRKLGGRCEIRSLPRDGLAETRLWAVSTRDGVALEEL